MPDEPAATGTPTSEETARADRRRYLAASSAGAALAVVAFLVVLLWGRPSLLSTEVVGGFYDAQAHALVHGHVDVDPAAVGFEGFRMPDGRTYVYQGIVPALARVPVVAVFGDRFDGRLTRLSVLAAFVVAMVSVVATSWMLRRMVRGPTRVGAAEMVAAGAMTLAAGGSSLLFLASKAWVYHEAILWGAAFAFASLACLLRWCSAVRESTLPDATLPDATVPEAPAPPLRPLVAATVLAGLAINTRASVGLGPVAAVGLAGVLILAVVVADRRAGGPSRFGERLGRWVGWSCASGRAAAVALGGLVVGLGVYAAVNLVRFGSLFGVPLDRQVLVADDAARQAALAANGNSLFALRFIPSVLWQSVRPDALGFRSMWPFAAFPASRPTVFGGAVFAERDWSSSLPVIEPALVVLAVVGLVAVARAGRSRGASARTVAARVAVVGALVGAVAYVGFGYIANRYLSDVWPFLALCGLVGLQVLAARCFDAGAARTRGRLLAGGLVLAAVWGTWVNGSLALQYRFEIAPGSTAAERAAWLDRQVGGGLDVVRVPADAELPERARSGEVAVLGRCDGLYRSNGSEWFVVEAGDGAGGFDATIERTASASDGHVADAPTVLLEASGPPGRSSPGPGDRLVLEPLGGDRFRLVVESPGTGGDGGPTRSLAGEPFALRSGERMGVSGYLDRRSGTVFVERSDGTVLLDSTARLTGSGPVQSVGSEEVAVEASAPSTPVCDRLLRP